MTYTNLVPWLMCTCCLQEGKRKQILRFPLAFSKGPDQPVAIHTVSVTLSGEEQADALVKVLKEHMPS